MNVKTIVKVMNFHALLRVDSSRKKADKYTLLEREIAAMIDIIVNNQNFLLDKKVLLPKPNNPELNIYFGSDFGFCGSINSTINASLQSSEGSGIKISVGKKIRKRQEVLHRFTREEFEKDYSVLEEILQNAVSKLCYSKINLIYNHYHNMSTIEPVVKCIYPIKVGKRDRHFYEGDFAIEGDVAILLEKLMISYLNYEVKIAFANSYASENIVRQNSTSESLKKIDEKNEQEEVAARKERNQKAFRKVIESYMKKKSLRGEG